MTSSSSSLSYVCCCWCCCCSSWNSLYAAAIACSVCAYVSLRSYNAPSPIRVVASDAGNLGRLVEVDDG
eukprot:6362533-Pyramimonas_sp.AAC.1